MKKAFWTTDGFAGVVFALLFVAVAYGFFGNSFQGLERYAYDVGVRASQRAPSDSIAVIAIDDESIQNIGRWPWPRDVHARMLDLLHQGGARVIANTILYTEPQIDPGLAQINQLIGFVSASSLAHLLPAAPAPLAAPEPDAPAADPAAAAMPETAAVQAMPVPDTGGGDAGQLVRRLLAARDALNTDQKLAASVQAAGNVVLAMPLTLGLPQGRPDSEPPDYVLRNAITRVSDPYHTGDSPIPAQALLPPIAEIGRLASAVGHLSSTLDVDGAQRFEPLVLQYYQHYLPSLSLLVAARALNLGPRDIEVRLGDGLSLGGLNIVTTPDLRMYNFFYGPRNGHPAFPVDSFHAVLSGRVPAGKFRDKIVLIGASAAGVGDNVATPVAESMPPVLVLAHTLSSILQEDYFVRPIWAGLAEYGLLLAIALYLVLLLPRLSAGTAAGVTAALLAGILATQYVLMTGQSLWLKLMIPAVFLAAGHIFMTVKLFRVTERLKLRTELEGAESNKMLGLAFQGQGQLDMAFDKFRKCPVDEPLLDLLYNLALDYERKRQFNKAGAVYAYMSGHKPDFRDLKQKIARAKQMEDTIILGSGPARSTAGGTLIMQGGGVEKPMLGRYEVEKELGRGAMGMVYLGRDPKIGRTVAIKTMALAQEFEESEVEEVKTRFFREAETAGRLAHPNIVTIFDAGEEHDLAYIAMEFIRGHDLTRYVKPGQLLPPKTVLRLVADAAEALDYAHAQGVVHRDIKPANLMYLPDEDKLKVTDFGVARLTDSSKTRTGTILGTPSYMSPEQLAGKRVDGRSDLFSLGVTLYQLLTGALPFTADSMTTLMYRIANEPHRPATQLRSELAAGVDGVIDRALQKDSESRYQRGGEMARDLRACLAQMAD